MAFNKILASLSVVLGTDTKRFKQGMKDSRSELQKFGDKAKKMAGAAVAGFTAVSTAALVAANRAAEYADKIDKTAISSGLSREKLQGLSYVADQAGIEFESLASGIAKLNRTMGDAAYGNKRQVEAFEKMGISIYDTNGQLKSMEEMFPQVVSALNNMENETERNALAMDLMGRSATQIIPRLAALGDEGIAELMTKASDLNMIMGDDAVAAFVKYKDGMSTLKQQFSALSRNFVAPFVDQMNENVIPALSRTMRKISEFTDRSVVNIQKEKIELNSLVGAITGANITQESRQRLMKELNENYPDFLKNIGEEAANNADVRDRLQEVNKLYDEKIKLAIQEQIYKRNSGEIADLMWEETTILKEIARLEEERRTASKGGTALLSEYDMLGVEINKLTGKLERNRGKQEELENQITETIKRMEEQRTAVSNLSNEIDYSVNPAENPAPESPKVTRTPSMGSINLSGQYIGDPMSQVPMDRIDAWSVKIDAAQAKIVEFSETVQTAFADMAYGVGESIGNMISGQTNFNSLFDGIREGFGKFAQDMGKLIIAYGFSMVSFQQAFANPWAAIGAGTALVAIGTMVRNAAQSPDIGGGGTAAAASSYSGSSYGGQAKEQTIKLVWERAGKDLVALINTENNAQNTLIGR